MSTPYSNSDWAFDRDQLGPSFEDACGCFGHHSWWCLSRQRNKALDGLSAPFGWLREVGTDNRLRPATEDERRRSDDAGDDDMHGEIDVEIDCVACKCYVTT